jgi:hypothetical protein
MAARDMTQPRRRSAGVVWVAIALAYTLGYLYAIGDLNWRPGTGVGVRLMEDAGSLMWHRRIGIQFEGIAVVNLPGVLWLASPLNLLVGLLLGVLVAVNALLGYRAYQQRQCAIGGTTAGVATLPALFSGAACCAPLTLLALGIPVTGAIMTLFQWLVPLAAGLMIASGVWLGWRTR